MSENQNLYAALAKAQGAMKPVHFDSTNPFLKNKFASLGAVIDASRAVLSGNGLSISQFPVSNGEQVGVTTILSHASGESISNTIYLTIGDEKGKSRAQVAGSIITYLRRYSWASVLGLYAEEDTDAEQGSPVTKPKPAPVKAPEPSAPAKVYTEADRTKFINAILRNNFTPKEIQQYAVQRGYVLPSEVADCDWPLHKLPATKAEFAKLLEDLTEFRKTNDDIPN